MNALKFLLSRHREGGIAQEGRYCALASAMCGEQQRGQAPVPDCILHPHFKVCENV